MTRLLISILATWRIASLLVNDHEHGPFDVFGKLRDAVGVNYTADSRRVGSNELAQVFTCIWCMSVWVGWCIALIQSPLRDFRWSPKQWFVRGLAYSAGAILIEKVTHG